MPGSMNGPRRADGQVAPLLVLHLRAHPELDFSPYELAQVLRVSHGTARRHLLRLAATGQVRRTTQAPARFQIST
ncbi:hypothetical protein EDC02_7686 [Micromonospora sp. Llam0]|uniref:hypothetical protein n=1 Tax=Micromonospora sp. Llam0 TaxID=2485143 RepID=UPI000FB25649|nr:hypothetical protein [Micromonospora sp. Llam0]ROO52745.1 hypothetical protein EDC02_7686 [Micromonospora sp. Llam0]